MHDTLRMPWRWGAGWPWKPGAEAESGRRLGHVLVTLLAVIAFAYCARTGWYVLQALRQVRLSELGLAADVLSVGDVVLCLVGYGLGKEILKAVIRRR